jgi:hypothetical protein
MSGVVYISGSMTASADHGVSQFAEAREKLRAEDYTVVCPSELSQPNRDQSRSFHLRRDFQIVLSIADEVCVLPDWERSVGSKIEVLIALECGLSVWRYDTRLPVTLDMVEINVKEMVA